MRRSDDQDHRRKDDYGSDEGARRDNFVGDKPAEKQRHHWIHQRVRGHARSRALLQNIQVRAEADSRAEDYEVGQRNPGMLRNRGEAEPMKLSANQTGEKKNRPADKTLHGHAQ